MMKRRTSKRFVLGDADETPPNFENDEATEVLPVNHLQKFQMTLETDPDDVEPETKNAVEISGRLLRPPNGAGTLQ